MGCRPECVLVFTCIHIFMGVATNVCRGDQTLGLESHMKITVVIRSLPPVFWALSLSVA